MHLHPTSANKVAPSENNNNNSDTFSQHITLNDKLTERKTSDEPLHNGKEISSTLKQKSSVFSPSKYESHESSRNRMGNSSSSQLASSVLDQTAGPNIRKPLKPLTIPEPSTISTKSSSIDIDGVREVSMDTNEKLQLVDIDSRMQRERVRILGGCSNASRIMDDQVFYYSISYLEYYIVFIKHILKQMFCI